MKVYIVTAYNGLVQKVFSTKEKAEEYVTQVRREYADWAYWDCTLKDPDIKEFEVH